MSSYLGLGDLLGMMTRSVRPGYFDWTWQSVTLPIDVDLESGRVLSDSWRALSCLRDCLAMSVRNYLVFKIAHILMALSN